MGQMKTATSKQLKMDLLEAVQAIGGKNRIIRAVKDDMAKGDNSSFWNLIRTCSSFVPKDMNITGGEGLIALTLQIPRPSSEYELLPEHVTVEGEVLPPELTMEEQISDKPTAIGVTARPTDKEGSLNEK